MSNTIKIAVAMNDMGFDLSEEAVKRLNDCKKWFAEEDLDTSDYAIRDKFN